MAFAGPKVEANPFWIGLTFQTVKKTDQKVQELGCPVVHQEKVLDRSARQNKRVHDRGARQEARCTTAKPQNSPDHLSFLICTPEQMKPSAY